MSPLLHPRDWRRARLERAREERVRDELEARVETICQRVGREELDVLSSSPAETPAAACRRRASGADPLTFPLFPEEES